MSKQSEETVVEKPKPDHLKPISLYLLHWAGIILGVWWLPTPTIIGGDKGLFCFVTYLVLSAAVLAANSIFYKRQKKTLLLLLAGLGATFFTLNILLEVELKYFSGMILLDIFTYLGVYSSLIVTVLSLYLYVNYGKVFREDNPTIGGYLKIKEWGAALVFAAILAIVIRTFIIQAFKIPSASMEDTLEIGDHLMVTKSIYGTKLPLTDITILPFRDPAPRDIIVFEYPRDKHKPFAERKDYIKRIVGLPGDRVRMESQVVYVNDEAFDVPQASHKGSQGLASKLIYNFSEVTVPEGHYFVLGDNRDRSSDSRFWGFVPKENIRGKAFIKYISWDSDKNGIRWSSIGEVIE